MKWILGIKSMPVALAEIQFAILWGLAVLHWQNCSWWEAFAAENGGKSMGTASTAASLKKVNTRRDLGCMALSVCILVWWVWVKTWYSAWNMRTSET